MNKLEHVRYLAHEGGGVLGVAQIPTLRGLEEVKPLSEIEEVAGASAGALLALMVNLGYDTDQILELLEATDWKGWTSGRWRVVTRIVRFFLFWGLFPNKKPRAWITARIVEAGYDPAITFDQLLEETDMVLHVTTTNMDAAVPVVFNAWTTPDVKVADAVLASMSVQLFFPPVMIDGERHCDGGLTHNHPIDLFAFAEPDMILGVRVDQTAEVEGYDPVKGPIELISRTIGIAIDYANRSHVPEHLWPRVVRVISDEKSLDFDLTPERVLALLRAGEEAFEAWLEK